MAQFFYDACLQSTDSPPTTLDFTDTAFFRNNAHHQLPDSEALRARCGGHDSGKIVLEDLRLFVKFGPDDKVRIEEAQTLQAIRRAFSKDEIPVPELVGWRRSAEGMNFIYMSLVPGVTLKDVWSVLSEDEKCTICNQLTRVLDSLRELPAQEFVCSISRTKVQDIFFRGDNKSAGPFTSVKQFNDRIQSGSTTEETITPRPFDPFRLLLPDTARINFSHADPHFGNIMISGREGSRSIAAVVDWGMSGWYPEYWEFRKLLLGTGNYGFYEEGWLYKVARPYDDEYDAFVRYWQQCCP